MDREVPERPLSVFGWGRWSSAIGQDILRLGPAAKVGQTVGCSTFTRRAKPATRRVADGERMNPPGKGGAYAPNARDDEHQGDEDLENSSVPGLPPRTPRRMGCRPRCFNPSLPTRHAAGSSLHQRGGTPHPEFGWLGRATQTKVPRGQSRSLARSPA